ncbi:MAG: hypothetical protein JSR99_11815 [Proteobacteria bacterium]|nr:hypothetical protein [Pseudomonadota bacterium]
MQKGQQQIDDGWEKNILEPLAKCDTTHLLPSKGAHAYRVPLLSKFLHGYNEAVFVSRKIILS